MDKTIIAGADIGGSHISVALIDAGSRKILKHTRKRRAINSNANAEAILDSWSAVIKESLMAANIKNRKLGIAMPGPFDYANGICYIKDQNKYEALYGLNVKEGLAGKLELDAADIVIVNDAVCFLQGEIYAGAGKGFDRVMGLTLGTGLGSAMAFDGEAADANLWCSKYKEGIVEDYLSARWFLKRYNALSGRDVNDVKELAGKIHDDVFVQQVFDEFGTNLATFSIPHITSEGLQLVILGGNISLAFPHFYKNLKKGFADAQVEIEIRTSALGEDAALIGAASSHFAAATSLKSKMPS